MNCATFTPLARLGLALVAALPTIAFSADHWTGAIRAEIDVTAPGYSHQETQLWTLAGTAPTFNGAYEICDATWSVTGQGWHDRTGQTARRVARWAAHVPGSSAPVAFFRPAPGKLVVQLHHGQLSFAEGYAGTEQYINNDGAARPERPLTQRLFEWTSWKIEPSATDTQITGSNSTQVSAGIAPLHPGDAHVTITLTWALGKGTAPPMPPPTLPPPPAGPAGGGTSGAGSGAAGPDTAADVSGEPRLLSVTPNFGAPGASVTLQLTGENTHWQAGGTMAAFGLGIAVTSVTVQSETGLTASVNVLPNAPAGPREVFVVSGAEFVRLANAFTVTSSSSGTGPKLLSVSPNSVEQGVALSAPVTLTGEGTHWQVGTTTATFGPGITIATGRVNSPTDFGVQLNVAADAPPGPRTVTVTTGSEVVTLPNALTVVAREQPIVTQVSPNSARAGDQNVTVTFAGRGTRWEQGKTKVTFSGQGVTLAELETVSAPTQMTVKVNLGPSAAPGPRDITVLNTGPVVGSDVITLSSGFTVLPGAAPPPTGPRITQVTPASAPAGARALTVSITGSGTHFNNVSWVEFGELVGATSFTVTSPTTATAVINIDPAAPPGPRTVSIITPVEGTASIPGETASLPNGFTVDNAVAPTPTSPTTARMTPFDPKIHGFRFSNTYRNSVFGPPITFFTRGLCGGMSYTALDYYLAGVAIPQQTFRPAHSSVLQEYIYRRQETSLLQNLDKWSEYDFNPFGSRNLEIFNWGLRERLVELRSFIDRGMPVPLGLKGTGGAYVNDHQVLAIGYDMGRYKGDVGQYQEDLKIFLCEPNYPGEIITMMADPAKMEFYYLNKSDRWRSYFVDGKHARMTPPTVANPIDPDATKDGRVHALLLTFWTGDEELRGGSLHVNLKILFNDGTSQEYPNISRGGRWLPQYDETVEVVLTTPRRLDEMRALEINTNNTMGPAGDRWDLESLAITAVGGGFTNSNPFKVNNPLRYKFVGLPLQIPR